MNAQLKKYTQLLGMRVMPIVKRQQYGAANWDKVGNLEYLTGEKRRQYAKRVVDNAVKEQQKENKEQEWEVYAVKSDGKFELRSELGYSQDNVSRSDFRILKHKKAA